MPGLLEHTVLPMRFRSFRSFLSKGSVRATCNTKLPGFRFLSLFRTRPHLRRKGYTDVKAFLRHGSFVKTLKVLPSADNSCFRESSRLPETSRHTLCSKCFPEAGLEIVAYGTLPRKRMNMLVCCRRCSATSLAILTTSPNANYVEDRYFSSSTTGSTTSGSAHAGSSIPERTLDQNIRNGPNTRSTLGTCNVISIDSIPGVHSVPSSHNPPSIDSVPSTLTEPTSFCDSNSSASSVSSTPSEPSNQT